MTFCCLAANFWPSGLNPSCNVNWERPACSSAPSLILGLYAQRGNPEKGREAAAPLNIKEIQEIQGGQEAPHDGDAINPKDA